MHSEKVDIGETLDATVIRGGSTSCNVGLSGYYTATCVDKDGNVKWSDIIQNTVTTVGKNSILDVYLGASTQITAWYLGLISSTSYTTGPAVGDTMASHGGWLEAGIANTPTYSQAARPTTSWSAASSGSKALSAAAAFSITGTGTVKGAFLNSVATKDGTLGTLYSAGVFTAGDKVVSNGDTVNVSYTATAS